MVGMVSVIAGARSLVVEAFDGGMVRDSSTSTGENAPGMRHMIVVSRCDE